VVFTSEVEFLSVTVSISGSLSNKRSSFLSKLFKANSSFFLALINISSALRSLDSFSILLKINPYTSFCEIANPGKRKTIKRRTTFIYNYSDFNGVLGFWGGEGGGGGVGTSRGRERGGGGNISRASVAAQSTYGRIAGDVLTGTPCVLLP